MFLYSTKSFICEAPCDCCLENVLYKYILLTHLTFCLRKILEEIPVCIKVCAAGEIQDSQGHPLHQVCQGDADGELPTRRPGALLLWRWGNPHTHKQHFSPQGDIIIILHLCHTGAKTHKTSELVQVVEKSGKLYTVKGEVGLSGLSRESRRYVELSDESHSMCLSLEAAIGAEEQSSTRNVPFFPITIGRFEDTLRSYHRASALFLCG